jgi:hypothetical protein
MPAAGGPNTLGESNLVFAIDTHDTSNGITPLGCGGFNGSTQGVKNLLTGTTYPFINGMKLTGRSYFTSFAIDYPESAYGGDAASRQGIATGYDVRSGGGLYGASRALHLWVYNNDTNSWIDNGSTTYFRGARLGGHCYDNYSGAENGYLYEIGLFISDYNTLKSTFPNCTFVVMGSHRADQYTAALRTILYDLGMPTGYIDSDYIPAPEWILIGEPGLGTGNAFGWVYENYTTNAAQVAHLNFGLPIKARGGIEFDGTNDYINITTPPLSAGASTYTIEAVFKANSTKTQVIWEQNSSSVTQHQRACMILISNGYGGFNGQANDLHAVQYSTGVWYHWVIVVDKNIGTNPVKIYVNGTLSAQGDTSAGTTNLNVGNYRAAMGYKLNANDEYFDGEIPITKIYNRALTAQEVRQNYQQYKTRFNLS